MQKKQTILVVASLLVVVLSVTLAYFTAQIIGKGKDVSVSSADLKIVFTDTDGNIEGNGITPGWGDTKTFTIENKSNETYKYNIVIQDLVNTFVTNGYLQYKITSTNNGYNMTEFKDVPKSETATDTILAYSVSIPVGVTQSYTIEFKYANDESVDQSNDMGKKLSGKLFITEGSKPTLLSQILEDNPTRNTRSNNNNGTNDFATPLTTTTTGTLFKSTESITGITDSPKEVYYYAGNTTNNWVKFGTTKSCIYNNSEVYYVDLSSGTMVIRRPYNQEECLSSNVCTLGELKGVGVTDDICTGNGGTLTGEKASFEGVKPLYWRIIRTNHDGSIRLLYVGTSHDTTSVNIGTSEFNTNEDSPKYVGYKYGEDTSLDTIRNNTTDSTIKMFIDSWYKNNLTAYTKYLSTSAVYCNDRELASGQTYSTTSSFDYVSWERIKTNKQPTYNCTNMSDAFSVNNTSAKLDYPVSLMTADEIAFAGGVAYTTMNTPYAWFISNSAGTQVSTTDWWSLSPSSWSSGWNGSSTYFWSWDSDNAYLNSSIVGTLGVRPVISLKSCIKYSTGNGTSETPYEIVETSSGC